MSGEGEHPREELVRRVGEENARDVTSWLIWVLDRFALEVDDVVYEPSLKWLVSTVVRKDV